MVKVDFSEPVTYQHKYVCFCFFLLYLFTNSTLAFSACSDSISFVPRLAIPQLFVIQNSGGASADLCFLSFKGGDPENKAIKQMETLFFLPNP